MLHEFFEIARRPWSKTVRQRLLGIGLCEFVNVRPPIDAWPPDREIVLHLIGDMRRFTWGFDGKKFSKAEPVRLYYGERMQITLINDTMTNHPTHLHGMFSELENDERQALICKYTINVQPSKQISFLVTADALGQWAFHRYLPYHIEAGMLRKVIVA